MSAGIKTTYVLPVEGGPLTATASGRAFVVAKVEWESYLFDGGAYRIVTAYAENHENRSWNTDLETIPSWVPWPPDAWLTLADEVTGVGDIDGPGEVPNPVRYAEETRDRQALARDIEAVTQR